MLSPAPKPISHTFRYSEATYLRCLREAGLSVGARVWTQGQVPEELEGGEVYRWFRENPHFKGFIAVKE